MVDTNSNDVVMSLKAKSGYLDAEATSVVDASDPMTSADFTTGKFFEVESFSVGLKLADDDKAGGGSRTYETWRSTEKAAAAAKTGTQLFFAAPDELMVTRQIDTASPLLLQLCLKLERLDKAVLVKRGRNNLGALVGFLKMEFTNVSIRSIDWTDSDVVREVCKFKYEKFVINYNRRNPDGSKMTAWNCTWEPPSNG